jgi:hypothetical protein
MREIMKALDDNGWHAGRACRVLAIGRATLWRRLSARGISLRKRKNKVWRDFWFMEKVAQARARGWGRDTGALSG